MNEETEINAQFCHLRSRYRILVAVLLALALGISLLIVLVMRQAEQERAMIAGQNSLHAITEETQNDLYRAQCRAESIAQETVLMLEALPESERRSAVQEIVHLNQVRIEENENSNLFQLYMAY